MMMKRVLVAVALIVTLTPGCATSPLGRSQLILFPEAEMAQMGVGAFQEMQEQAPVLRDGKINRYVQCVASHVIRAMPGGNPADWEVLVFDGAEVNAFALPGRKIGVYRGLLKVAENQHQLAAVIGHEIAHVTAKHANERVSTQFVTESGLQVAQIAAGATTPVKQELFGLLGLGAQVGVLLPFNRKQESEADLMGLDLMADAGFDPRESVSLWRNMEKAGGQRPPDFLSTHPSSTGRITELDERMKSAMNRYNQARVAGRVPDCAR